MQKVSFNSFLDNYFCNATTSRHCKNFGTFLLVKTLTGALLCQELLGHGTAVGRGSGSKWQLCSVFQGSHNSWLFCLFFFKVLVKQP